MSRAKSKQPSRPQEPQQTLLLPPGVYVLRSDVPNPRADRRSRDWFRAAVFDKGKAFTIDVDDIATDLVGREILRIYTGAGARPLGEGRPELQGSEAWSLLVPHLELHPRSAEILELRAKAEHLRGEACRADAEARKLI